MVFSQNSCRYWVLLGLILMNSIIISCNNTKISNASHSFQLIDSVKLPALSFISPSALCVRYYSKDEIEYLFWGNSLQNNIELYNLSLEKHIKTISIPEEGPRGIRTIKGGFKVLNFDTIFVNNINTLGDLYIIDTTGLVYDIIKYSTDTAVRNANSYINLNTHIIGNVFSEDNKLIIPLRTPFFRKMPDEYTIAHIKKFNVYNFESKKLTTSPIQIDPDIYIERDMYVLSSVVSLNERYYYQHQNSPNIYYTDDLTHKQSKKFVSEYFIKFLPENTYATPFENVKHSFYYYSLQSDPFKNLLYRIIKLPASDPQLTDGYDEFYGKWDRGSIMVFDADLNLLDEFLFPTHGFYSWYECFVGRKGFYLKRSPNHPHYSESKITFDIFEFRETENMNLNL